MPPLQPDTQLDQADHPLVGIVRECRRIGISDALQADTVGNRLRTSLALSRGASLLRPPETHPPRRCPVSPPERLRS